LTISDGRSKYRAEGMAIGDRRPEEENGGTGKRKRRREDEQVMMFIFCTICVK